MVKEVFANIFASSIISLQVLRPSKIQNRKSQGAMEFMMTYGWAILVILISLTALYYFGGVGSSSKSTTPICILPPGFSCNDFQITTTSIKIVIQNGIGVDIEQLSIEIKNGPVSFTPLTGQNLKYGESKEFEVFVDSGNSLNLGQKFKGDIVLTYMKSAGTLTSATTGSIGGTTETTGTPPAPVTCTDTDSGTYPTRSYNSQGTVSISTSSWTDSCASSMLTEYYCNLPTDTSVSSENQDCSPGNCINGACVSDTTAPIITNVQHTFITETSAIITWTTNELSSGIVSYGTSPGNYPAQSTGASGTSHSVPLTGLNPSSTYYYKVSSTDASGNTGESINDAAQTFTTLEYTYVCSDTDNDDVSMPDYYTQGTVTITRSDSAIITQVSDTCSTPLRLREVDCTSQTSSTYEISFSNCPSGCSNGACQ